VQRALLETREPLVLQATQVRKVSKVNKEFKEMLDLLVQQEPLEILEP
jgi:hypothetical protein